MRLGVHAVGVAPSQDVVRDNFDARRRRLGRIRQPAELPVQISVRINRYFRLGFRREELRGDLLVLEARLLEHDAVEEAHPAVFFAVLSAAPSAVHGVVISAAL